MMLIPIILIMMIGTHNNTNDPDNPDKEATSSNVKKALLEMKGMMTSLCEKVKKMKRL